MFWWNPFSLLRHNRKQFSVTLYQQNHSYLGSITKPLVPVKIWAEKEEKWRNFKMVADTGADLTVLPSYIAILLDINLKKRGKKIGAKGVGGVHSLLLVKGVRFRVGPFKREVTVGFIDDSSVPPLMGRHLFLESLETTFEKDRRVVFRE